MNRCEQCKEPYEPKVMWQRFCSEKCHDAYWSELRQLAKKLDQMNKSKARE